MYDLISRTTLFSILDVWMALSPCQRTRGRTDWTVKIDSAPKWQLSGCPLGSLIGIFWPHAQIGLGNAGFFPPAHSTLCVPEVLCLDGHKWSNSVGRNES